MVSWFLVIQAISGGRILIFFLSKVWLDQALDLRLHSLELRNHLIRDEGVAEALFDMSRVRIPKYDKPFKVSLLFSRTCPQ